MSVLAFWAIVSDTKHPDISGSGILMNTEWGLCALWIGNQRPVLRSHDQWGPIIGQGPDTTVKLPHDTQKGQPNAIPKISMLSLLSPFKDSSSLLRANSMVFLSFSGRKAGKPNKISFQV